MQRAMHSEEHHGRYALSIKCTYQFTIPQVPYNPSPMLPDFPPKLKRVYATLRQLTHVYVIVRPLSTVGYTSVAASAIHRRQWSIT